MRLKGRPVNHLGLMVVSCTAVILFYTMFSVTADREQEELVCKRSPEATITHSKAKCQKLRRIFATLSANKTINERSIMRNAVELQRCPWLENRKKKEFYRSEINQCCNTSHELIVTQENTQVGEDIVYERQKSKKINVTTKIFNMLSFHPVYLENLAKYWRSKGLYVKRLSSGIMLVSAAMELCDSITLYGFWPFYSNLEGRTIGYHYYDKMAPNIQVHAMPKEFLIYSQMHAQGALKLQVGQCS